MNLSKYERLVLYNQYTIMEKLFPEDMEIYSFNKKVIEEGYAENYCELTEFLSDELDPTVSKEIWDILQMHRSLNVSYRNLPDKGELKEEDIKFRGFDGNNETRYMIYARFVFKDFDRYHELQESNSSYNSHWPMLEKYRRMLRVWESITERYNNNLDLEQIKSIINA